MEHSFEGNSSETSKLAVNWLLGAGLIALAFSVFLVWSDTYLTNSTGEQEKAAVISEMRHAQHSFSGRSVDNRQIAGLSNKEAKREAAEAN